MGAICLSKFCAAQDIHHESIDDLLKQLWKIATAASIMEWDRERRKLELSGRGDPLPANIAKIIEEPLRSDFERLVNCVGMISDCNMFRDPVDRAESRALLSQAIEIVKAYGADPPDQALFAKSSPGKRGWGRPIREELLREWKTLA